MEPVVSILVIALFVEALCVVAGLVVAAIVEAVPATTSTDGTTQQAVAALLLSVSGAELIVAAHLL